MTGMSAEVFTGKAGGDDDTNKCEESQDARREREHCGERNISCQPPVVSDKRSNAQARMTMNQQSKVFDTDYDIEAEYKILKRYQRTRENLKDEGNGRAGGVGNVNIRSDRMPKGAAKNNLPCVWKGNKFNGRCKWLGKVE